MFYDTKIDLTTITLLNFNAEVCTNMSQMFYNCRATTITLSNFNVEACLAMYYMFFGTSNLQNLNIKSTSSIEFPFKILQKQQNNSVIIIFFENIRLRLPAKISRCFYSFIYRRQIINRM